MAYENPIPSFEEDLNSEVIETEFDYKPMDKVYFAFIDVLGFKKDFDDLKISPEKNVSQKYRDVFNYYFSLMNAAMFMHQGEGTQCYAGQTSDSLYFYTERTDYLMQFIKIFSHFSLYAMSKNVFFRGGIAKGKLYKKEMYQFYGDSVIGAYLLESNISKKPVIVIDDQTHKDMCRHEEYEKIIETEHECHYIKPFYYLENENSIDVDPIFTLKPIFPEKILNNILSNKSAFEYDDKNYEKYVFLLNKFPKSYIQSENRIK